MSNTFDWIEMRTQAIETAARFYEALFGWKVVRKEEAGGSAVWIFDTGGEPRLENLRRAGLWLRPAGEAPGVVVYVRVEDLDDTLRRVVELGGQVVGPRLDLGGSRADFFTDPGGTLMGLYQD